MKKIVLMSFLAVVLGFLTFVHAGTYSISGSVKDISTNQGIPAATVTITNGSNTVVATLFTDQTGNYTATVATAGDYYSSASKTGYEDLSPPPYPIEISDTSPNSVFNMILTSVGAPVTPVTLDLAAGWNFISFPKNPPNNTVTEVLKDISSNVRIVWGYDNTTKGWLKYKPGTAGALTTMVSGLGYWVYMDAPGSITMTDWTLPSTTVALKPGWNLVGYNGTSGAALTTALNNVSGNYSIAWNWNNSDWFAHRADSQSLPVPDLTALDQKKAYWIKTNLAAGQMVNWQQSSTPVISNNFPVVVFSDVHFNPFYNLSPSTFQMLVAADASGWASIFQGANIPAAVTWGLDTNYPLLVTALSNINQNLGTSPLVIYTGDIIGHKFQEQFYKLYDPQNASSPTTQDVSAMYAFTNKTVAFVTEQIRSSVGNIPVMFAVGNTDSYTNFGPDSTFLANTAGSFYTNLLNGATDHQAFLNSFLAGGYYSAEPAGINLMVISLNTNLFAQASPKADLELAWLDSRLASAKTAGKKVWLLMHIPPGANITANAGPADSSGQITSATMMWDQDYQARFLKILSDYPDIIPLMLGAHTHMDEYRIPSPYNVLEITPAITPYSGNNPAFKIYTFDKDTLKPIDYTSLNYDLSNMPPRFSTYYTFSTAYSMQGFLNDSLAQLFPALRTNNAKQALYSGYYYSGHNSSNPAPGPPITNTDWPVFWCGIGVMDQQEFINCVNSYVPLNASNLNLIFVVSPDLTYHASGDIYLSTGNLTNKGLQRSLLMAPFLQQQVLGSQNVTAIYALEPMTHLQTASSYPDMAALVNIQQFALLNQITIVSTPDNSYPINTSYAAGGGVPGGVAPPLPSQLCADCQGLVYNDASGNNIALAAGIINKNTPGFHVFSAPWETISDLMTKINALKGYKLTLPTTFTSPNHIYTISIPPSGSASLITYNTNVNPPSTYPVLPPPALTAASCPGQDTIPQYFSITVTGGVDGAIIPKNINNNQTVYMIRHAEAHPAKSWEDGNYVGAGQWRALSLPNVLPNALRNKPSPNQVYSIDPAQIISGGSGSPNWSYVRPSLTAAPYAIANNLPYNLISNFQLFASDSPKLTSEFLFTGGTFSNQTVLLAWEHDHFPFIVHELLLSYGVEKVVPLWPSTDYDTIWTVTLDPQGNVTIDNALCEGIDSALLPATPPRF